PQAPVPRLRWPSVGFGARVRAVPTYSPPPRGIRSSWSSEGDAQRLVRSVIRPRAMTISIGYCSAETSAFSRSLRRTCRRGQWGDIVGMIVAVPRLTPSELEALGLYHPGEPDAAQRLELLEYLVSLGATGDDLVASRDELPVFASA